MKHGICKLCRTDTDLQWSHYLGKALYRLQSPDGERPYFSSSDLIIQDQKQIGDYLLCSPCEQLFDKLGEKYVFKMVDRNKEGFEMLRLIRANPFLRRQEGDYTVYRAADVRIDTEPLAYFALSIIFRGTHVFRTFDGRATGGLQLGDHEEPIRRYLLGIDPFPNDVAVKVSVALDEASRHTLMFPYISPDQTDATAFTFITRGLWFDVVIGSPLPAYAYDNCCVSSVERLIYVGDFDRYVTYDMRSNRQTARLSKKLQEREMPSGK